MKEHGLETNSQPNESTPEEFLPPTYESTGLYEASKLVLNGRSGIFYYWPVFVLSFLFGFVLLFVKRTSSLHMNLGLVLLAVLMFIFSVAHFNKKRFWIFSIVVVLFLVGWREPLMTLGQNLGVSFTPIVYFSISGGSFLIWIFVFSISDRATYYEISPQQIKKVNEISEEDVSYPNPSHLSLTKVNFNFFRNAILGPKTHDLKLEFYSQNQKYEIVLHNVLYPSEKIRGLQAMFQADKQS